MKIKHTALLKSACFIFILSLIGPMGIAMAGQNCNDVDGYGMACRNSQPTRLDLIKGCTDIDGFATPCRNQQKVRFDMVQARTDYEGFPIASAKTQKAIKGRSRVLLTAQNTQF